MLAVASVDVRKGGDAKEEAAALGVDEVNGLDVGEGGKVFHQDGITFTLRDQP
jgi:hypothetical protein